MFSCSEVVLQPRVAAAAALKDTGATLEGAEGMHAETVRRLCYLLLSPPPPHPGTGLVSWVWCVQGAGRAGALPSGGEVRCRDRGEVTLSTLIDTEADKLTVKD